MSNCAVLIPVYKPSLSADELFSVNVSIRQLNGFDIWWVAPKSLDLSYYLDRFPTVLTKRYPDRFFDGIAGYNRLLVSENFYSDFSAYSHILICQPDAIILQADLGRWIETPFDYIGAPWPKGCALKIEIPEIVCDEAIRCLAFVGNGGLSLRRNSGCISLIREFPRVARRWYDAGHAEDLFFGLLGNLSRHFVLPNLMTAAHFSHDVDPEYLVKLTGGKTPFGVHAWALYNRAYWESVFRELGLRQVSE